jgi:hypothetical protein
MDTINELGVINNLVVGNQSVSMDEWINIKQYEYYSQCYIGLSLSKFAGGGTSIIELGLCGIKSVNNIRPDFPNSLTWNSIEDIKTHIENEKLLIGSTNKELSEMCYESLDHKLDWLNI